MPVVNCHRPWTKDDLAQLAEYRLAGLSLAEIASRIERTVSGISCALARYDLPARHFKRLTDDQIATAIALRKQGEKLAYIALVIGCAVSTVANSVKHIKPV